MQGKLEATFARRLYVGQVCKKLGITQGEIARRMARNPEYLSGLINGRHPINKGIVKAFADATGESYPDVVAGLCFVDVDWLRQAIEYDADVAGKVRQVVSNA